MTYVKYFSLTIQNSLIWHFLRLLLLLRLLFHIKLFFIIIWIHTSLISLTPAPTSYICCIIDISKYLNLSQKMFIINLTFFIFKIKQRRDTFWMDGLWMVKALKCSSYCAKNQTYLNFCPSEENNILTQYYAILSTLAPFPFSDLEWALLTGLLKF